MKQADVERVVKTLEECDHKYASTLDRQFGDWCNVCGALWLGHTWAKPHWVDLLIPLIETS